LGYPEVAGKVYNSMLNDGRDRGHLVLYHSLTDGLRTEIQFQRGYNEWKKLWILRTDYAKDPYVKQDVYSLFINLSQILQEYKGLKPEEKKDWSAIEVSSTDNELSKWTRIAIENNWTTILAQGYTPSVLNDSKFGDSLSERFTNTSKVCALLLSFLPEKTESTMVQECTNSYYRGLADRLNESRFRKQEILLSRYVDRDYALSLIRINDMNARRNLHETWLQKWGSMLPKKTQDSLKDDLKWMKTESAARAVDAKFLMILTFAKRLTIKGESYG
jgi:hypothetical protein